MEMAVCHELCLEAWFSKKLLMRGKYDMISEWVVF